ncbi:nitric-oxide reductase large subunit [Pelagicoccus sp. SDUM812003]|uniref:nitric-oxide reductase large subunit n=1 Tax=Pelagicoccus sp. SDUM812003 TaxID=3041267 RepID=UPI00280F2CB4|nr:nitric-oxide reductase large subunit [Pelagicoccus sp. SDUM812003]MDQ8204027.1 nitric-oxide reductase large subunit [Pelagicoccus sp. SDUM812003]
MLRFKYANYWLALSAVIVASFATLGYYGLEIYRKAPPIPERVRSESGETLFTGEDIRTGQNVWQSIGGQEVGSIWGHGSYVAPDWNADWAHRELLMLRDRLSERETSKPYAELSDLDRLRLDRLVKEQMRRNTYDSESGALNVSEERAEVIKSLSAYYAAIFGDDTAFASAVEPYSDGGYDPVELRDYYAIARNTIKDEQRQHQLNAFFFWTTWATTTVRDEYREGNLWDSKSAISYTNNWPAEDAIGNAPSSGVVLWSIISVILLLVGIAILAWRIAASKEEEHRAPGSAPKLTLTITASMRATYKYFAVVGLLLLLQIAMGILTAHYGVEGDGFFGFPLADWIPYSVTRTWHTQLGIFWIATAWLATGLFLGPAVSGYEPKFQRIGVDLLFVCLVVIVFGSLFGEWLGTRQTIGLETNFWFGHQGYEYVDLGRFWQIFLFVGLFLWLGLMVRAIWPALRKPSENRHLIALFLVASTAIALFYGAGLMWGKDTHLALAEYWRWWVVHLWVEGFFEVFATVVIAFLFTRLKLIGSVFATKAALASTTIFLFGGIIGTFHHIYFSGTPTSILALGSVFSALEVAPLVLIGFEAVENLKLSRSASWVKEYKWPIYFFVSVAFWNLVGAGIFGFLINPPIALYYMQGLNTTAVHGHTALFGVYGMLGIGLVLFCLKGLRPNAVENDRLIWVSFWGLNAGLTAMVLLSLLPIGLWQVWASLEQGMWYARSAEFMQSDTMEALRWLRTVGDILFAVGVGAFVLHVFKLAKGGSELELGGKAGGRVRPGSASPESEHALV